MTWPATHLSVSIDRSPADVAAFAGDPANLPLWAAGLGSGLRSEGERWFADLDGGTIEIRFTGPVEAGVLDHDVVPEAGETVHNPLRVLANDLGSEVVFTLFRRPGVTDADLAADAEAIAADLLTLKRLLEG
ncbi:SRPBCC family protein [Herbiconiux sp. CPCC 205716]|uniref:SRPBCC family protein n=1 Tax=Herbiconiux gentiana TaxID=2970912 RepID=A0ABT2GF08_9MICO|nr:SRPBCC family protein [Herbiconiux gentiana]MCS5713880.1 SRPBCC family protein [Herbiconiux gentiana]